jgi:hypothetical protein
MDAFTPPNNQHDNHVYSQPENHVNTSHTYSQPENHTIHAYSQPENHTSHAYSQGDGNENPYHTPSQVEPSYHHTPSDLEPPYHVEQSDPRGQVLLESQVSTDNNPTNSGSENLSSQTICVSRVQDKMDQNCANVNNVNNSLGQDRPAVVILPSSGAQETPDESEGQFTFGFEVNESLLAMSSIDLAIIADTKIVIDEEKDKQDNVSFGAEIPDFAGQETGLTGEADNQPTPSLEENEMLKNLLSLSDNCGNVIDNIDGSEDDDVDSDVVVENTNDIDDVSCAVNNEIEPVNKDFSALYRECGDKMECGTFNYDVIVHFVQDAWDVVKRELKGANSNSILYYSS